jgi:hypothetical protein
MRTWSPCLTATVTATSANYGERWRTLADEMPPIRVQGERWRTVVNAGGLKNTVLKTTKVQAFGGSNPSPSANFEYDPYFFAIRYV